MGHKSSSLKNNAFESEEMNATLMSHVLSTNSRPTTRETAGVRAALDHLEPQLMKAKEELDAAQEKYEAGLQIQKIYLSAFSPARRFSPSLWLIIFKLAVATSPDHTQPLLLSTVCQNWREIVFDCPELWTKVPAPKYLFGEVKEATQGMASWVRRSQALPLTMIFRTWKLSTMDATELFASIPAKQRWRKIEFENAYVGPFLNASKGCFKQLESLTIKYAPGPRTDPQLLSDVLPSCFPLSLIDLPQLTHLHLDVYCYIYVDILLVPFHQLTHLALAVLPDINHHLDILFHCENLEELKLLTHSYTYWDYDHDKPKTEPTCTIEHPKLLRLTLGNPEYNKRVLGFLDAPALVELSIIPDLEESDQYCSRFSKCIAECISDFILQSKCSLQKLKLVYAPLTPDGFLELLPIVPALRSLIVKTSHKSASRNCIDERIMIRLKINQRDPEPTWVPKLETLVLSVPTGTVLREGFVEWVEGYPDMRSATLEYLTLDTEKSCFRSVATHGQRKLRAENVSLSLPPQF